MEEPAAKFSGMAEKQQTERCGDYGGKVQALIDTPAETHFVIVDFCNGRQQRHGQSGRKNTGQVD